MITLAEIRQQDIMNKTKDLFGPIYALRPEMDIVCERGTFANENPRNQVLIDKIRRALPDYDSASLHLKGRGAMITDFFTQVTSGGGRFLMRIHETTQEWKEINDKARRDKISYLFRDEARKARNVEASFAALENVAV
ncbi:unnamed protein product [Cylindrotheca closterium]|uniref:DUF6824 domain-containing protein n=1 Tax=Cylindrotheca closterium TaxID=2856 RepID=A0AAD2G2K7_9STRA|nr:unnamed protein product [Cylindrotheca closterium]